MSDGVWGAPTNGTSGDSGSAGDPAVNDGDLVERASVRRNIAHMASSQVVTWTLATAISIIIPRFIKPRALGDMAVFVSVWAIVGVLATLGTSLHLQRAIARNQREGLELVMPVFVIRTLVFALASILLCTYGWWTGTSSRMILIGVITGVTTLLGLWSDVFNSAFVGLERMATAAVGAVLSRFTMVALTLAVLLAGAGLFGVLWVYLGAAVFALAFVLRRFLQLDIPRSLRWRGKLLHVVADSAPFMLVGLAVVTYRQVDVIVISWVVGSRDLGWYAAADSLVGSLLFPTTIIMTSIFPTFGRVYENDPKEFEQLVNRTYSMLFLLAVPIGLGAMAVAPAFTELLYGRNYAGTGSVVAIMSVVTMFTFGAMMLSYAAFALGRERFVAILIFASAALTIPLDAILVPWAESQFHNGAIGGAVSYVVTESLQFFVFLVVIAPFIVTRTWAWKSARVLAAGLIMMAVVWPIREVFVLVPASVGALVYVVMIVAFRALDTSERELARDVLGRVRRRPAGQP